MFERIAAIDLARFVALAGMFAAHTWGNTPDGSDTLIGELVAGRAAALFAVLAGIGVVFVTRRALEQRDKPAAVRMLVARGLVILIIGLILGLLDTNVYVVIAYYGLLFMVMAPLVLLRSRWLAVIAVALALLGPLVNVAVRETLGVDFELGSPAVDDLADPLTLVRALLVTGIYPVLTWLVYGLVGVLVGRAILRRADTAAALRRTALRIAAVGAASAALGAAVSWIVLEFAGGRDALVRGWGDGSRRLVSLYLDGSGEGAPVAGNPLWFAAATPHTGTPPDLLITIGSSLLILGALLALLPAPSRRVSAVLLPALGAGGAPLTIYAVHVVLTTVIPLAAEQIVGEPLPFFYLSSGGLWVFHLAVALILGSALRLLGIRGPLEVVVTVAGRRAARLAPRPAVAP